MRWIRLCLLGCVMWLSACGGGGSPAPAPTGLSVQAGDTQVTLNWNTEPGVEYWILYAPAPTVDASSWSTTRGGNAILKVQPPYTLSGLINGVQYAFAVNGRVNGGPGGPASPSIAVTPREAGETWTVATTVGTADLRAATYGLLSSTQGFRMAVAGGDGMVQSSADGTTWSSAKVGASALHAITFAFGKVVVAGDGGLIASSTDLTSFTPVSTGLIQSLRAVASNASKALAVGTGGTILGSSDATSWSVVSSGVSADLHALVYSPAGYWIAVGAAGTVLKSADGASWQVVNTGATQAWRSVTVLPQASTTNNVVTTTYRLVAVGDQGQVATSTDGEVWTRTDVRNTLNLRKVIATGTRFLAVGAAGALLTSSDGQAWRELTPVTSADLNTLVRFGNVYRAFGAGGVQLESR